MTRLASRSLAILTVGLIVSGNHSSGRAQGGTSNSIAGVDRAGWTALGPDNLGGDVTALAFSPSDSSPVLAGTALGGIWRSTDGGAHWTPVDDFLPSIAITNIAFDPSSPTTVYATSGSGLLMSTDAGSTWSTVASFTRAGSAIAISSNGTILVGSGVVYRSTDHGATWTATTRSGSIYPVNDIQFLPGSDTNAVLATETCNGCQGWYFSVNGGTTWSQAVWVAGSSSGATNLIPTAWSGRDIATTPLNPTTVFLTSQGIVLKSTDGGASYATVHTGVGSQAWVDPTNGGVVVVAGTDVHRSVDGGTTWTRVVAGTPFGSLHAAVSDRGYDGASDKRLYFAGTNGVFRIDDILSVTTSTPNPVTTLNQGLSITPFDHAAGHTASGTILGSVGTQSYVLAGGGSASAWTTTAGYGQVAIDATNVNYRYSQQLSNGVASLLRTLDGGATAPESIDGNLGGGACKPVPYVIESHCPSSGFTSLDFAPDPQDPNTMIVANNRFVWRTRDARTPNTGTAGPTWQNIRTPGLNTSSLGAMAFAPSRHDVFWIVSGGNTYPSGYNESRVLMTEDATAADPTWIEAGWPGAVSDLEIDPGDPNVVYAGSSGSTSLYRTTNRGRTWTPLSGAGATALPTAVRTVAIHPSQSNILFVGTDAGVYGSVDAGTTWAAVGPANVRVTELFWMGTDLVAATRGRGMFRTTTSSTPAAPVITAQPLGHTANTGTPTTFTVGASGSPSPTYQWQVSTNGGASWSNVASDGTYSGATAIEVTITPTTAFSGFLYRCIVTNSGGSVSSDAARLLVNGPTDGRLSIDTPSAGVRVGANTPFLVGGWAIDRGAESGTGIDAVQVWAFRNGCCTGTWVGQAVYGKSRPDVAAVYGARFANSGFDVGVTGLGAGTYGLTVYARSTVTGSFSVTKAVTVTAADPVPVISLDTPGDGAVTGPNVTIGGWAVDRGSTTGTGMDAVHVYAFPIAGGSLGSGIFLGASYGGSRPDVAAAIGAEFVNSGFTVAATLSAGQYRIVPYAHSSLTNRFYNTATHADITIAQIPAPEMALDVPAPGATVGPSFAVGGWAIDRAATTSTGVDAIHVWAFPAAGGAPTFLGQPEPGRPRPDIAALFGEQFLNSGYLLNVTGLSPGVYDIVVYVRSTLTGTFNQSRVVRVTVSP